MFQKFLTYVIAIILLFFTAFLPIPGTGDLSVYYNTHAIILSARWKTKAAVRYWQKSATKKQHYSNFTNLGLAIHYLKAKDIRKTVQYLNEIPISSFAAAANFALMGDLFHMTKFREIASYYPQNR